ncbi:GNAT family N-acetyltransferase [Rhizobium sp. G21]|uniref:GNAT family N-acetyltransferase n=1 Tax=Rhizobium sp. G21 TaxID=2758439 RepID=UPI00160108CB|nr:GNAT family N-acetyltransferase [Rhizobium sp. G21]MBB1248119.1 GNAT family N-acetyltransferase [Rhizobium sp. G21]
MIRRATKTDLETLVSWAAKEGWNPGLADVDAFWRADPEGYWVDEMDGEIAAGVSLVHHHADYGFLGFYIVAPQFRGQGLGFKLWSQVLAMSQAKTVGLDGVVAQQENYRKSGFAYAHANARYGAQLTCEDPRDPRIVRASEAPLEALLAYDAGCNPASRARFLAAWLDPTADGRHGRLALAFRDGGAITGLGAIRACGSGYKIGPLFADSPDIADRLFRTLIARVGGGHVYLDIPMPNPEARALALRYGMHPVFETARMYRGHYPELPLRRIFGVTTFELG